MKRKRAPKRKHSFDKVCEENGIKHKLTKFRSSWTNGQVEVFNRVLKEQTTKKYFDEKVKELKEHVTRFVLSYNYQRKQKSF
jgi:transposase InsO family protein